MEAGPCAQASHSFVLELLKLRIVRMVQTEKQYDGPFTPTRVAVTAAYSKIQ